MAENRKRLAMVIDLNRCVGCWTCAVACKEENNVPLGLWWNRILTVGGQTMDTPEGDYPNVRMTYMPVACFHCDNPPCVQVCPVGATYQRDDGIVMMDYEKCIGCRYCMVACPYNNRVFNWETPKQIPANEAGYHPGEKPPRPRGVVEKCDFCYHRVDSGLDPTCVAACPTIARVFGDANDPESRVHQIIESGATVRVREDLGTEPSLYYIPQRKRSRLDALAPTEDGLRAENQELAEAESSRSDADAVGSRR